MEGGAADSGLGPTFLIVSARYRQGLSRDLEGNIEGTLLRANEVHDSPAHRNAYAGRLGVKHQPLEWLALAGGVGGGGYAGGGFVSPDLAAIVAYENRYFVPFALARGYLSLPFAARRVDLGTYDGERIREVPRFTLGYALAAGFRLPLSLASKDGIDHSFYLAGTWTHFADGRSTLAAIGVSGSFELLF